MPGIITEPTFKTLTVKELHPTFAAEVEGADFLNMTEEQFGEVKAAMAKYGICVFRNTGLDDDTHVAFSKRLGPLDDMKRYIGMTGKNTKLRYNHYELFDAGNVDDQGGIIDPESTKAKFGLGNRLFHVDSSFNPCRASLSLLRAYELPPPGNGGETQFADSRSAYEDLPAELKEELLSNDYVAQHSIWHSRKVAAPDHFKDLDVDSMKMSRHKLVQTHEPSGRTNLYISAHAHHLEDVPAEKSKELLDKLLAHVSQPKYVVTVPWINASDLIIWDNTCVLHRACGGAFEGKYRRDLRRTTVHDQSSTAWGLNEVKNFQ